MTGRWFSPGTPVSSSNKTDRHDITEILLKVALQHHKPKPNLTYNVIDYQNFLSWSIELVKHSPVFKVYTLIYSDVNVLCMAGYLIFTLLQLSIFRCYLLKHVLYSPSKESDQFKLYWTVLFFFTIYLMCLFSVCIGWARWWQYLLDYLTLILFSCL